MQVLLVGASGMLGTEVKLQLHEAGFAVEAPNSSELDITDPAHIPEWVRPEVDWVVNCAAYTAVDRAEEDRDAAVMLNSLAPGYLGRACAVAGARFIHVSTDFVFDGTKREPYTEEDRPNPLGVYGSTKRDGEEAVLASGAHALIVRTAWLFGPAGGSFPRTILRAALAGKALRVVADQVGTPTYAPDLARVLLNLIERDPLPGVYHAAGPDIMSWHQLATMTVSAAGIECEIEAIGAAEWPTPAPRPAYSALSFNKCASLGIAPMLPMDEALPDFLAKLPES